MVHKQTLFSATFEESKRIVPNMFKNPFLFDDMGNVGSYSFWKRLLALFVLCILSIWTFFQGVVIISYEIADINSSDYTTPDIYQGIVIFNNVKYIIVIFIYIPIFICIVNLLPVKNYKYRKILASFANLFLILEFFVILMPLCLGVPLGALGWLGFITGNIYGIVFFLKKMKDQTQDIKGKLYGKQLEVNLENSGDLDSQGIDKIWSILKKYSALVVILIVINVLIFRIGMWGERTIWSIWGIGIVIYWAVVTIFSKLTFSMVMRTFYFVKYAEQYRQLWKATDEQWYGPRKAKKLARKRAKIK